MTESKATIVISTKNRKDDLRGALASAITQTACDEVLLIDDGSTDGTFEMVHTEFPTVRVIRHEVSTGYIVARNEGARLAKNEIVVSIDDDAVLTTPNVVAQTLAEFDDPRIGAVAIPYIDVRKNDIVNQRAPDDGATHVCATFIGTSHALRRSIFNRLGGYREHLTHQCEERDYSLRMLAAGYVVRMGRADVIHHFESPKRDRRRMYFYNRRNDVMFAWQNVPRRALLGHLVGTSVKGAMFHVKNGVDENGRAGLKGIARGWRDILREERQPVPMWAYALHRKMLHDGGMTLNAIARLLPTP